MSLKIAVVGFRHGHIHEVVELIHARQDVTLIAGCEDHPETRAQIAKLYPELPLLDSFERLLNEVELDAIAVGDYYSRRGSITKTALQRGKHVLSDKPVCTSLEELDEIQALLEANRLVLGCQFTLRGSGVFRRMRRAIQEGEIGTVHAVSFNGQHPLNYGTRPGWYFEPGKHGGTVNDIAIHAIDLIPWLTGRSITGVAAARNWSTGRIPVEHFRDAAQVMLTLDNNGGVLGDVSYLTPDSFGFSLPHYWQFTVWGDMGMLEASYSQPDVTLYANGHKAPQQLDADPAAPQEYLQSFLNAIRGTVQPGDLTTSEVLTASRNALLAQGAADE